jgi:endonuclease I
MKFRYLQHKILLFSLLLLLFANVWAQAPDGYYDAADGKKEADLKTALFHIIKNHTQLEYYASSTYFLTTDWHPGTTQYPNGYFWDMYSNYQRTTWNGMNREHSLPKSWWSAAPETTVAYSDLHNLYPSDATANSAKLNYGLGEVTGTPDFTNGVVKVGANGFPGYTGTVFEPADEYKGDFARDYMYVVTCYEDYANNWRSTGTASMLLGGTYPVFREWAVNLLLKWHRQDPVSSKETNRNNAVYSFQHNRNPFIDHPELAEFIWGKYVGSPWSKNGTLPEEDIPLTVQPNPVSSILTAKVNNPSESTYYILNLSGIVMKTGKFTSDGTLSVDELPNDMYILMVYSDTSRKVTKFIVHH